MTGRYDDIIHLPHHISDRHPQMSAMNRAAQFAPFAALTGHGAAIDETARRTEDYVDLDEVIVADLNEKLVLLRASLADHPCVTITWFTPDERKDGGAYRAMTGAVKKIDEAAQLLRMEDGTEIPIASILEIDGEMFSTMEYLEDGGDRT